MAARHDAARDASSHAAEDLARHLAFPLGCQAEIEELLRGVGKTVLGTYMTATRGRNTLVLMHRGPILDQWETHLSMFLGVDKQRGSRQWPDPRSARQPRPALPGDFRTVGAGGRARTCTPLREGDFEREGRRINDLLIRRPFPCASITRRVVQSEEYGDSGGHDRYTSSCFIALVIRASGNRFSFRKLTWTEVLARPRSVLELERGLLVGSLGLSRLEIEHVLRTDEGALGVVTTRA